jgi:hypothetical protein
LEAVDLASEAVVDRRGVLTWFLMGGADGLCTKHLSGPR